MKVIFEVCIVAFALVFELVARLFHSVGSVCMSAAIMLLGAVSSKTDKEA